VLIGEATDTNVIVLGLTRPGLEPPIYRNRGEHSIHYATDAVKYTTDLPQVTDKVLLSCIVIFSIVLLFILFMVLNNKQLF
jgi:hypothetical protein